jgi:DNA replication protein DnaC
MSVADVTEGAIKVGPCEGEGCTATARREQAAPGTFGARFLNAMPLLCDGCRAKLDADLEAEEAKYERTKRLSELQQRIVHSGIPTSYDGWTLDKLDGREQAEAVAAGRRFAAGYLPGLALTGPYGVGKTAIAAAAAKQYMWEQRRPLQWLKVHAIINDLGRGFGDAQRDATLNALGGNVALVLDDLDKTKPTEHAVGPLFTAVDECVSEGRPLIVTTNLTIGQLAEKWANSYGDAIASRLAGYCETHLIDGHDRRLDHA